MTEQDITEILQDVKEALQSVDHGKITIELRGTAKYTDVVVEHRKRHSHTKGKTSIDSKK